MTALPNNEIIPTTPVDIDDGPALELIVSPEAESQYELFLRPAAELTEDYTRSTAVALAEETKEAFTKYQSSKPDDIGNFRANVRMHAVQKMFKIYRVLPITVQNQTVFQSVYYRTEQEIKQPEFTGREAIADLAETYAEHPVIKAIDAFWKVARNRDDAVDMKRTALLLIERHTDDTLGQTIKSAE